MTTLKVTTTREIIVPKGTRQINTGDKNRVSFIIKGINIINYYTSNINDLPSEIIPDDFVKINDMELKTMSRFLKL